MGWAEADPDAVDAAARAIAVESMIHELRRFAPTEATPRVEVVLHEASVNRRAVYRIWGEGWIDMGGNGWVFIRVASSHDDPHVGDVILAIDDRGRIFENASHVCSTVAHFTSTEKLAAGNPDDFFGRFAADVTREPWLPRLSETESGF